MVSKTAREVIATAITVGIFGLIGLLFIDHPIGQFIVALVLGVAALVTILVAAAGLWTAVYLTLWGRDGL